MLEAGDAGLLHLHVVVGGLLRLGLGWCRRARLGRPGLWLRRGLGLGPGLGLGRRRGRVLGLRGLRGRRSSRLALPRLLHVGLADVTQLLLILHLLLWVCASR